MKKTKSVGGVFLGLFVVAFGVLYLLEKMSVFHIESLVSLCIASLLFVFGLLGLVGLLGGKERIFHLGVMLLGAALFAKYQPWLPAVSAPFAAVKVWHLILTAFVLVVGLSIIGNSIFGHKTFSTVVEINSSDDSDRDGDRGFIGADSARNVFGEKTISFDGQVFNGYELESIFGTVTVDLRGAIIENDTFLHARSVFGEVRVLAGDNANYMLSSGQSVFGSSKINRKQPDPSLPTVKVTGDAVFGSVEVL